MNIRATGLEGVLLIEPEVFCDPRGYFLESFRAERYPFAGPLVQDNVSFSRRGVLRGLHFQWPHAQGKLVCVVQGEVFDVVVDLRRGSAGFRRWEGHPLSEQNHRQLWIPPGFAHGFAVTSESARLVYKCTEVYDPRCERCVRWNDPDLAIDWPVLDPELSPRDAAAPSLSELYDYLPSAEPR